MTVQFKCVSKAGVYQHHDRRATSVNRNRAYVVCRRCGLFDIVLLPEGRWRVRV